MASAIEAKCQARTFLPSYIAGGVWLEGCCGRKIDVPNSNKCALCNWSNLLGVVTENIPEWVNMWSEKSKRITLSGLEYDIAKAAHERAARGDVGTCIKGLKSNSGIIAEMPGARKPVQRILPLDNASSDMLKSQLTSILVHSMEKEVEPLHVSEVIYKKVKKVIVNNEVCYDDNGKIYQCGKLGDIKGHINS
jgi:hypothetical protein